MQIKNKNRVASHGEVFTSPREVNAMLDLVKHETERIDSRFLEPACGTGNFLVEILGRKLNVVEMNYSQNQLDYEFYSIIALTSIYGVDILEDNLKTCKDRLLGLFTEYYSNNYKSQIRANYLKTAKFILDRNIIWGDALNLKTPDEKQKPIVFSEWNAVTNRMVKRRDYTLSNLLQAESVNSLPLFSDSGIRVQFPVPVKEFPLTHFLKLGE